MQNKHFPSKNTNYSTNQPKESEETKHLQMISGLFAICLLWEAIVFSRRILCDSAWTAVWPQFQALFVFFNWSEFCVQFRVLWVLLQEGKGRKRKRGEENTTAHHIRCSMTRACGMTLSIRIESLESMITQLDGRLRTFSKLTTTITATIIISSSNHRRSINVVP